MSRPALTVPGRVARAYDRLGRLYEPLVRLSYPGYARAVPEAYRRAAAGAGRVLEIGPGTGIATRGLAAGASGPVVGLDLSRRMLAIARSRVPGQWLQADACAGLPLRDACIDLVAVQYAAGHFSDPRAFLREAQRVLRPGGRIVLGGREARGLSGRLGRWLNATRGLDREATPALLRELGFRQVGWSWLDPQQRVLRTPFLLVEARR